MEFYKKFWRGYFNFKGRTSPRDYWLATLVNTVLYIGPAFFYDPSSDADIILRLHVFYVLATIIPSIAMSVRRLHDINKSGFWLLAYFIPLGVLLLLFFYICRGDEGENLYGPSPLAAENSAGTASSPTGESALPQNTGQKISVSPNTWKTVAFCLVLFCAVVIYPEFSKSNRISAPEFPDGWTVFVPGEDANDLAIYLNIKNASPDEELTQAWFLHDFPEEQTLMPTQKKYRSHFTLEHFDCTNSLTGISHVEFRSENRGRGKVVFRQTFRPDLERPSPESTEAYKLKVICELMNRQKANGTLFIWAPKIPPGITTSRSNSFAIRNFPGHHS